jgi:hypothetical protein
MLNIILTLLDKLEDQIVLLLCLHRDEVHAVLAADVAAVQPVNLPVGQRGDVAAVEVVVSPVEEFLWSWGTIGWFVSFYGSVIYKWMGIALYQPQAVVVAFTKTMF